MKIKLYEEPERYEHIINRANSLMKGFFTYEKDHCLYILGYLQEVVEFPAMQTINAENLKHITN